MGGSRRAQKSSPPAESTRGAATKPRRRDAEPPAEAHGEAREEARLEGLLEPTTQSAGVVDEVVAAVATLYTDELRPYGRILRKRLAERAERGPSPASPLGEEAADAAHLRELCESCSQLRVVSEEGGEFAALLVDRPASFVDIYNCTDPYPEEMWQEAAAYFRSMGSDDADNFPGGRYASAQALVARRLPFLRGRSLGQVCHIIQLSIAQRQLLGYSDGAIVPYSQSTSMRKSRCAMLNRRCGGRAAGSQGEDAQPGLRVASWEETVRYVRDIMERALEKDQDQVPLSNIKRLFRSQYGAELSETVLGHAKLSELLLDSRFSGICTVRLQERGYAVIPAKAGDAGGATAGCGPTSPGASPSDSQAGEEASQTLSPDSGLVERAAVALDEEAEEEGAIMGLSPELRERRTFLELATPPSQPGRLRAFSCPKDFAEWGKRRCLSAEMGVDDDDFSALTSHGRGPGLLEAKQADEASAPSHAPARVKFCEDEPLNLEDAELLPGCVPLATPSPLFPLWQGHAQGVAASSERGAAASSSDWGQVAVAGARLAAFCPGEPLCLDAVVEEGAAMPLQTPSPVLRHPRHLGGTAASEEGGSAAASGVRLGLLCQGEQLCVDAAVEVAAHGAPPAEFCPVEPLCLAAFLEDGAAVPLQTPSPALHHLQHTGSERRVVHLANLI